jgi:hypothetical protein
MNNINYYKKYSKYKNKFLEIKNNLIGGYKLSYQKKGSLLYTVLSNILRDSNNSLYFKFDEQCKKNEGYGFDETLEYLSNDKDYNLILPYLLDKYLNDKPYTQLFYKENCEIISEFRNMIPYHVNIGALMFLSFITELEIFTLFHSIIPFNTNTDMNRNSLNTAFCRRADEGLCTKTRIYRDSVNSDITQLFTNFTTVLDETFKEFMDSLINQIKLILVKKNEIEINEIERCIIPKDSAIYTEDGKYDYIFADWKERLCILFKKVGTREVILGEINLSIKSIITQKESNILNYIAEATGFFSYFYLINPDIRSLFFGSCITYSMFELYIMSRLHTRGENMILCVEKEHTAPHSFWYITQQATNIPTLTHFATSFTLSKNPFILRSKFILNGIIYLPFAFNKLKILKLFIFIIYDMYAQYFFSNKKKYNSEQNLKIKKIIDFMKKRITYIEENTIINKLNIRNILLEKLKDFPNIKKISIQEIIFIIDKLIELNDKEPENYCMLDLLSTFTSFNIIQWFLDLKKIGLNIDKCIILSIILTSNGWPAISNKPRVAKKIFKDNKYLKNLTKDILDENDIQIFEQGVECFTNT